MIWGNFTSGPGKRLNRAVLVLLAAVLSVIGGTPVQAQVVTTTASAEAIVVSPLSLVANETMNFGRIAPSPAGGTVVLNPDTNACTVTGTIIRVGTCQPAEFTGMGVRRMRTRITIPTTITLTRVGGGATMTVSNLTLDTTPDLLPIGNGNNRRWEIQPASGIFDFRVGGTLTVGPNQAGGTYNGTFVVTVQYQ
jgi:hypothetical protein